MIRVPFSNTQSVLARFAADNRGNVAMLFAFCVIPVIMVTGAAMDFSRALAEKERLQSVVDSTALALAKEPKSASLATLQAKAESYFRGSFQSAALATSPVITVTKGASTVRVEAAAAIPTVMMSIAGVDSMNLHASSDVRNEHKKIEIALILDNTGSMADAGKMAALKTAVNDLIIRLQGKIVDADDVKMSIVPFNTEVKVNSNSFNANWLRWDVTLENPNYNWSTRQPPSSLAWQGCIADRDQPYDISSEAPQDHFRRYVASQCHYAGLTEMLPLSANLEAVRARANEMTPTGNTNVTIGLAMGLATLRTDSPFGAASSNDPNVQKFVILLTDGDNTQNRWTNNVSQIDNRLSAACTQAKTANSGIKIFTVRVIAGNAALLKSCATNPSMYYDVQNAGELQSAFKKILETIDGIRIVS